MRRGFKSWAENEAVRLRQELGLRPDAPLSAEKLADYLGVVVMTPEEVPGITAQMLVNILHSSSGWSAATIAIDGTVVIIHNHHNASVRQESDLMHELAHILCKHPAMRIVTMGGIPIREYSDIQEEEATWLGGCLQLPRVALWSAMQKGLSAAGIMSRFNASEPMVRYRRNVTGIDVQFARTRSNF